MLFRSVASRAHLLCRLGKEHPNLPASLYYSTQELAVLDVYKKKIPQWLRTAEFSPAPKPELPGNSRQGTKPMAPQESAPPAGDPVPGELALSVCRANMLVAMLGGYWGRKGDGLPGPKMLAQGLMVLAGLVEFRQLSEQSSPRKLPPRKRSPKPG